MSKPRTWTIRYQGKFGTHQEGPWTDKAVAVRIAQSRANETGNDVRVSTRGHFGSLTVNPEGAS